MKYVVLSVNSNPDYLYYTPICCWAWKQFGYTPILFYGGQDSPEWDLVRSQAHGPAAVFPLRSIEGYRNETVTQLSRLYGACVVTGYLMTSDIDMLPLSDYWNHDVGGVNVYGHDLTAYRHFPICYIGMASETWREVMHLATADYDAHIDRDIRTLPQARDPDFGRYWYADQDLITERLYAYGADKLTSHHRGTYPSGYARDRVDRGDWRLDHERLIDCHMLRDMFRKPRRLRRTLTLLRTVFPHESLDWLVQYTLDYAKIRGVSALRRAALGLMR